MQKHLKLLTTFLVVALSLASPQAIQGMESESASAQGKRENSQHNQEHELAGVQKKAIRAEDKEVTTALVEPKTLGYMIKHIREHLDCSDLCRLAQVSSDTLLGVYLLEIWKYEPLLISLSAPSIEGLRNPLCPFEQNPVEVVFDISNPLSVSKNIPLLFDWMISQGTSNLTLNINMLDIDTFEDHPNLEHLFHHIASTLMLLQDRLHFINSLGFKNSRLLKFPSYFCKAIATLFPHVTHFTLDYVDAFDVRLFDLKYLSKLTKLESLTLWNLWDRDAPSLIFEDFMRIPTIRTLTIINSELVVWRDFFISWPVNLESLVLKDVSIDISPHKDGDPVLCRAEEVDNFLTELALLGKELKTLEVSGFPINLCGNADDDEKARLRESLKLKFENKFSYVKTLILDW